MKNVTKVVKCASIVSFQPLGALCSMLLVSTELGFSTLLVQLRIFLQ